MAVEFTRFYNGVRITVRLPEAPSGRLEEWQDFLLDIAKCLSGLVPEGNREDSIWRFTPYATRHEGDPSKEIKVQLFFPCAPILPIEAGSALLELLLYGIIHSYEQEQNTAWHLGILSADVKGLIDLLGKKVMPSQEKMAELRSRYGYSPMDTISKN